jgi:hypothetical protein
MRLPRKSATVRIDESRAISQRSASSSGAITLQLIPRAQPTRNGPVPIAPIWMSPLMIPSVIGVPDASCFHSTRRPGYAFSSRRCCLMIISGA